EQQTTLGHLAATMAERTRSTIMVALLAVRIFLREIFTHSAPALISRSIQRPTISERWEELTARQAVSITGTKWLVCLAQAEMRRPTLSSRKVADLSISTS